MITFDTGYQNINFFKMKEGVGARVAFLDRFGKESFGAKKYSPNQVQINGRVSTDFTGKEAKQLLMSVTNVVVGKGIIKVDVDQG